MANIRRTKTLFLYFNQKEEKNATNVTKFPVDLSATKWGNLSFTPTWMCVKQVSFQSKDKASTDEMNLISCDFLLDSPSGYIAQYTAPTFMSNQQTNHKLKFRSTYRDVVFTVNRLKKGDPDTVEEKKYDKGWIGLILEFRNFE